MIYFRCTLIIWQNKYIPPQDLRALQYRIVEFNSPL